MATKIMLHMTQYMLVPVRSYKLLNFILAAEKIPEALLDQLANGGQMIIPVGPSGWQVIKRITKDNEGKIYEEDLIDVRYVPLTSKEKQWNH